MSHKTDFTYQPVTGIGRDKGVCRRDPGDVIKVGDVWYVWYTKVVKQDTQPGRHGYPSGYQGSVFFAVSRDAGRTWSEKGEAVPKGVPGTFDYTATFTPNILFWKDRYWLYYSAVGPGFDNGPYADRNRTSIGLCVADKPNGPWKKAPDGPVFTTSRDPRKFDSYRVDDTCFLVRQGEIWMYYKGRQWQRTPGETKMGVAVADRPEGPFRRLNHGEPVQDSGHEVLVWPLGKGVMSLVSNTGPNRMTLQYAEDGVNFEVVGRLPKNYPKAPGVFRPDLTDPRAYGKGVTWGISMAAYRGDPYLQRYEINLEVIRGLRPRDLADEDVPPADLPAVGLQLDRPVRRHRLAALEVVREFRTLDDVLAVEPDVHPGADHPDAEVVPLAEGFVGPDEGVLAGRALGVVPQAAVLRALCGETGSKETSP